MYRSILAVGFVAVLQVFASDASATDRPSATTASRSATEMGAANVARARASDAGQSGMQASLSDAVERKQYESQSQTVNRNFASPKPIRIYFFFGGR